MKLTKKECLWCDKYYQPRTITAKYCSKECRDKARRTITREREEVVNQILLPHITLDDVGKFYGVTRERIRGLFKAEVGRGYGEVKKDLFKISKKFLCLMCGIRLRPNQKLYCSEKCYRVSIKFDFKSERTCKKCNKQFYPHRNWKHVRSTGTYCSQKCYMNTKQFSEHAKNMWKAKK